MLVYHSSLTAQDPAQAHAALTVDGQLIWEETVPIPSISLVYAAEVVADFEAKAGSEVSYAFLSITLFSKGIEAESKYHCHPEA